MKNSISLGKLLAAITFLVLIGLALLSWENFHSFGFGAEYGNIAAAIVNGHGYGQPFSGSQGPTAWMLPLNTFIYVLIFAIFGVKSKASIWACIVVSCFFWSLSAHFLYKIARLVSVKLAFLAVLGLWFYLRLNKGIAYSLDDIALINVLTIASLYYIVEYLRCRKKFGVLLVLAFLLPLVSPGLFVAFVLIFVFRFAYLLHEKNQRKAASKGSWFLNDFSRILYLGLTSLIAISMWGFHNYQTLGVFIPSKSNFWYEFYQANMADEDGILNHRTFKTYHPGSYGKYRVPYDSLGEIGFVNFMKQRSLEEFVPSEYLNRVANRARFALIRTRNTNIHFLADTALFSHNEKAMLKANGLVEGGNWIALDLDSLSFSKALAGLHLNQEAAIRTDWGLKKEGYVRHEKELKHIVREIAISLLPFLCIIFGLCIRSIRSNSIFQLSSFIYFTQLLLYILVSHYSRYQYYLTGLQALFVFYGATYVLHKGMNRLRDENLVFPQFIRKLKPTLVQVVRSFPYSDKLLGIPKRRISCAETQDYFEYIFSKTSYYKEFNANHFILNPPRIMNSNSAAFHYQGLNEYRSENFLIQLEHGRYYSHSVFTKENNQLAIASNHAELSIHEHVAFNKFFYPKPISFRGTGLILVTQLDTNYYHCLFQIPAKICFLRRMGFDLGRVNYYLLELNNTGFQKEILEALGLSREKIIDINQHPHVKMEKLLVTPVFPSPEPWMIPLLKQTFLEENSGLENEFYHERIYISRSKAKYRKVMNEDFLWSVLKKYGFIWVSTENMTIKDQAKLFSKAKMIVSVHGAALANTVFCQTNTRILELRVRHKFLHYQLYEHLSSIAGLRHYTLFCDNIPNRQRSNPSAFDLKLEEEKLEDFILEFINGN